MVEFAVTVMLALLDDAEDFVWELAPPAELLLGAAPDDDDDDDVMAVVDGEAEDDDDLLRDNERERALARRFGRLKAESNAWSVLPFTAALPVPPTRGELDGELEIGEMTLLGLILKEIFPFLIRGRGRLATLGSSSSELMFSIPQSFEIPPPLGPSSLGAGGRGGRGGGGMAES